MGVDSTTSVNPFIDNLQADCGSGSELAGIETGTRYRTTRAMIPL
jgi:hypothetical protein